MQSVSWIWTSRAFDCPRYLMKRRSLFAKDIKIKQGKFYTKRFMDFDKLSFWWFDFELQPILTTVPDSLKIDT